MFDNFEPYTSIRTSGVRGGSDGDTEAWHRQLLQPAHSLLHHLSARGVLEQHTPPACKGESSCSFSARDGQQRKLGALWRFFDSRHDALRRCIDHYERSRAMPACASRRKTSTDG